MLIPNKRIINLRSVFCGYQQQHDNVLGAAQQFFKQDRPGIFVVGGTNLTGKTTLTERIKNEGELTEYDFFRDAINPPPKECYIEKNIEFSNDRGTPQPITLEQLYEHDGGTLKKIPTGLDKGVRTIFLPEVWAGHGQALELVRDELVRKHRCRVILDAVSSGEGTGFFDSTANNNFIEKKLSQIFSSDELYSYNLDFNRLALREGVLYLAQQPEHEFDISISIFPKEQRDLLIAARNNHNIDSVLAQMLGLPIHSDLERK